MHMFLVISYILLTHSTSLDVRAYEVKYTVESQIKCYNAPAYVYKNTVDSALNTMVKDMQSRN